jgi:tRNA 2-thiocytidine biosynthesis protein TtcA
MKHTDSNKEELKKIDHKINRAIGKAIARFGMIEEEDKIMVAVSGGKDSLCMLHYLMQYQKKAPIHFDLIAVNVDQKQPGFDKALLPQLFRSWGVAYEIAEQDTYSVVVEKTPTGKSYCALCSRMRRGILYEKAMKLGCNKVALGHHMDDVLETFLLNTFFSGKLAAMPARYQSDKEGIEVIRPLFYTKEEWISAYSSFVKWPILPCNLCGSQENLQRQEMKKLLNELNFKHPQLKDTAMAALHNVDKDSLFDERLTPASQDQSLGE